MARRRLIAVVLLAFAVVPARAADLSQAAALIVNRTNIFREEQGLKPHVVDPKLQKAAQEFARFMAKTREYGHTADGRTPAQRASAQGRSMLDPDTTQTGVAIAQGREPGGHYFAVQMFGLPKSAAIRFSVRNEANRSIAYSAGDRSFTLAQRAARTHTVCRTLQLMIAQPGQDAPFTARPKDGVRYSVTGTPDGLSVREVRVSSARKR